MVEIKICGITREEDLKKLIEFNISWAGFVFYKKSVRNVDYNNKKLFDIGKNKIGKVALFVDPNDGFLEIVVEKVNPDLIQLHGSENPERCSHIRKKFGIPVMKALHIRDLNSFEIVSKFENFVDRLLFDAKLTKEKLKGGITETLKWELLNSYRGNNDWLLAGGLNHNNVTEALKISNAKKIDVSSGVEIAPGIKCELLLKKLIDKTK
jgi:phosphoribosylanthranilate isomerase